LEELESKIAKLGYKIEKGYKSGGQANTMLLSKKGKAYLLKTPKNSNLSTERKFRLEREIKALELLGGKGVPHIFEYSTDCPVFIIMEFIKGKTLSEFTNGSPMGYQSARTIFLSLLDTIENAHSIGLYHRDLKPDNIVVRDADHVPVIIDFGICWMKPEEDSGYKTHTNIEMGNRFLRLPELSKGSNVTVSASDITFLVGIFYFLLVGKSPHTLLNEHGEPPHYREEAGILKELAQWRFLQYFFDKGFTYELSLRYQTVESLKKELHQMEEKKVEKSYQSKEALEETLNSPQLKRLDNAIEIIKEAQASFLRGFRHEILETLAYGGSGPNYEQREKRVRTSMYLVRRNTEDPKVPFFVIGDFDENFETVTSRWGTKTQEFKTEHTINEKNRLMDEFEGFGRECAQLAMGELDKVLQDSYK